MSTSDSVARYYDRNTRRFLLVGRSGERYAIHRELWGPGVTNVREAAGYVNRLVGDVVADGPRHPAPTILDLGCGVGGTLFALAARFPHAALHGVTISARQAAIGGRLVRRKGLERRCRIDRADFQAMSSDLRANAVVGIEALVHATTPARFFSTAAAHLAEGGRILIVDDFLARPESELSPHARRQLDLFRLGWRAPSVCTVATCLAEAARVGLRPVHDRDLTPLVRTGRPRDQVIAGLSPLFMVMRLARRPFFANMIGGNALQIGLREGFFEYRMLVFEAA